MSDGTQAFSVFDFISVVCQKAGWQSRQVWTRLLHTHKQPPFMYLTVSFQSDTSNPMHETPGMTVQGLLRLLLVLDTKVAARFHQIAQDTLQRSLAGDASMITVDRPPTPPPPTPPSQADAAGAKRQLEREDALFTVELRERQMALQERQMALYERSWALCEKSSAVHKSAR